MSSNVDLLHVDTRKFQGLITLKVTVSPVIHDITVEVVDHSDDHT